MARRGALWQLGAEVEALDPPELRRAMDERRSQ
ncbi:hypothetical protein J2S40_003717 [Nocardioides luteus]|nr:hypothetical protein [Nocardioides luteus]